ncbi:MAG: hypothetical protein ACOYOB_05945 [Myxococcota bacterium]
MKRGPLVTILAASLMLASCRAEFLPASAAPGEDVDSLDAVDAAVPDGAGDTAPDGGADLAVDTSADDVADTGADQDAAAETSADTELDVAVDAITDTAVDDVTPDEVAVDVAVDVAEVPDTVEPCTNQTCDDGQPCTADSCKDGACSHLALAGAFCNDGDACTTGDKCVQGLCKATGPTSCDDGQPCTIDTCDKVAGCQKKAAVDGIACEDGSACTAGDACETGKCAAGKPVACDDGNVCTDDSCDAVKGCVHPAVSADMGCDDGDACTEGDVCDGAICKAGKPLTCDDGKPCTTDKCVAATGCTFANTEIGTVCNDGNDCTVGDKCDGQGKCGGAGKDCNDDNPCTSDTCANNVCAHGPAAAGDPCSDDNPCTLGDACKDSVCVAGTPKVCDDNNPCTADACVAGTCKYQPKASGACDDGDGCTVDDACDAGVCVGGAAKTCDDNNTCTKNTCVEGSCSFPALSGLSCDDGDGCTLGDTCQVGQCKSGAAKECGDSNPCTDDSCAGGVCANIANTAPCNDGEACTVSDQCSNKSCQAKKLATVTHAQVKACGYVGAVSFRQRGMTVVPGGYAVAGDANCGGSSGNDSTGSMLLRLGPDGVALGPATSFYPSTSNLVLGVVWDGKSILVPLYQDQTGLRRLVVVRFGLDGVLKGELLLPTAGVVYPADARAIAGGVAVLIGGKVPSSDSVTDTSTTLFVVANDTLVAALPTSSGAAQYSGLVLPVSGAYIVLYGAGTMAHHAVSADGSKIVSTVTTSSPQPNSFPGAPVTALGLTGDPNIAVVAGYQPPGGPSVGPAWATLFYTSNLAFIAKVPLVDAGGKTVVVAPMAIVPLTTTEFLVAGIKTNSGTTYAVRMNTAGQVLSTIDTLPQEATTWLYDAASGVLTLGLVHQNTQLSFAKTQPVPAVCK